VTDHSIRVFLIIILMIVVFGGGLYLRALFTKRAVFKVIEIFYQHNALGITGAKTLHELGIERPDFLQRMMRRRDYRLSALRILMRGGMMVENEDGRFYLVEEKLDQNLRRKRNDFLSHGRPS
jgi:hypothetical protein